MHIEIEIDPATGESLETLRAKWLEYLKPKLGSFPPPSQLEDGVFGNSPSHLAYGGYRFTETSTGSQKLSPGLERQHPPLKVHVFVLNDESAALEELETGDGEWTAACEHWSLPHRKFHTLWESLIYEDRIAETALHYATSSLLFADRQVSPHIIHWNRMLLLHGPPGTGKTSLCKALAQKLSIRWNDRFTSTSLLEIHVHSLFSKWFSTSGKLIQRLTDLIQEMVQDEPNRLVCVLMDEVESLASQRRHDSNEPVDALRAVNSLLTGLDQLRQYPNVLILATTNLTGAVDSAFLDRVDWKLYVGLPCVEARRQMLESSISELQTTGILASITGDMDGGSLRYNEMMQHLASQSDGLSGRSLRRLPLQAHALHLANGGEPVQIPWVQFSAAMDRAIQMELQSLAETMGNRREE